MGPYIADEDEGTSFTTTGREVGERVGRGSRSLLGHTTIAALLAAVASSAISATTAEAAAESTSSTEAATTSKSSPHTIATTVATSSTEASPIASLATLESTCSIGISVFSNLESSALPVVAVELLDRISSIVRAFESDDTSPFWSASRIDMDIGSDNAPFLCYVV